MWCWIRDSNPYVLRQRNLNPSRLPISPIQQMVGVAGLEPATSCPQSRRATAALYPEIWWAMLGSNQRPVRYERTALTICANGPCHVNLCMITDRFCGDQKCSSFVHQILACFWPNTSSRNNGSHFSKTGADCCNTDSRRDGTPVL